VWCASGIGVGTLTFNIHINDFSLEISKISEIITFVDDTSILCIAKDFNNLKIKLGAVFSHKFTWFQNNQFVLNLDKTKMVKFTPTAATNYPLHTLFFNKMLKAVETITFLGLQLDNLVKDM
jgi:hypothetical protein